MELIIFNHYYSLYIKMIIKIYMMILNDQVINFSNHMELLYHKYVKFRHYHIYLMYIH